MEFALNVLFVGMTVVFIALIVLTFAIYGIAKIINSFTKPRASKKETFKSTEANTVVQEAVSVAVEESDEDLIAVLTAAVLAAMGNGSQTNIVVKSFRRIPQAAPVWNTAGRNEYISNKL